MSTIDPSLEMGLPELAYGSVWLASAGDGDPRHLSPLAVHALGTADAVIHDPGIAQEILDLVKPPRYREAAAPGRAIERSIKLAQDGWRVVHLVEGNALERAIECATSFAEQNIPLRIAPTADEPLIGEAPIGLLLIHKPVKIGRTETGTLVVLIATPQSEAATNAEPRPAPLSFSMSGLAG
jgi:uroporphyrin-III C-methyltransferase